MYDIKLLEKEWKKYHHKKYLSIYVGVLALFLILLAIVWFVTREKLPKSLVIQENNLSKTVPKNVKNVVVNVEKKVLEPVEKVVKGIQLLKKKEKRVADKIHKKMKLNIIEASSVDAYKDVEKRFYISRNIEDSLFLAKTYFRKGNYKKSKYWALQTNKIDSTIDESWIIFVKSKLNMGHKNEAISILKKYIKRTGSEKAIRVLNTIEKNN